MPHGDVHDQVVEAEDKDHPIENPEVKVFIQRVGDEPVDRPQDNDGITDLGSPDLKVIGFLLIVVVVEQELEVFMVEVAVVKLVVVAELFYRIFSSFMWDVGDNMVQRLVKKFKQKCFLCLGVVPDPDAEPVGAVDLAGLGCTLDAGFESSFFCLAKYLREAQLVGRVMKFFYLCKGEDVLIGLIVYCNCFLCLCTANQHSYQP